MFCFPQTWTKAAVAVRAPGCRQNKGDPRSVGGPRRHPGPTLKEQRWPVTLRQIKPIQLRSRSIIAKRHGVKKKKSPSGMRNLAERLRVMWYLLLRLYWLRFNPLRPQNINPPSTKGPSAARRMVHLKKKESQERCQVGVRSKRQSEEVGCSVMLTGPCCHSHRAAHRTPPPAVRSSDRPNETTSSDHQHPLSGGRHTCPGGKRSLPLTANISPAPLRPFLHLPRLTLSASPPWSVCRTYSLWGCSGESSITWREHPASFWKQISVCEGDLQSFWSEQCEWATADEIHLPTCCRLHSLKNSSCFCATCQLPLLGSCNSAAVAERKLINEKFVVNMLKCPWARNLTLDCSLWIQSATCMAEARHWCMNVCVNGWMRGQYKTLWGSMKVLENTM